MKLTTLLCLLLQVGFDLGSPPGIYVDNGLDQTIIDMAMTKQEKREMELEILNLLGLPNRPRRINNSPLKKSAPRFLLDVYKTLMEDENKREERSVDLNLSGEEQNAIDKSDVIMTFESISKKTYVYFVFIALIGFSFTHASSMFIYFTIIKPKLD